MTPQPVTPGGKYGPQPIPPPKPKKPKPAPKPPTKKTITRTTVTAKKPTPKPYDPYRQLTPEQMKAQAQARAQADLQGLIAALPSQQKVQQGYNNQRADLTGLTGALLNQIKGVQTYQVQNATGIPQGFSVNTQQQAPSGVQAAPGEMDAAARTLAAFGTNAANQQAANYSSAASAGAGYQRAVGTAEREALEELVKQRTEINAQKPGLVNKYLAELQDQAFQTQTAKNNYELAGLEMGVKGAQAQSDAALDNRKQAETERHNRAAEAAARARIVASAKAKSAGDPAKAAATAQKAYGAALKQAYAALDSVKGTTTKGQRTTGWNVTVVTGMDENDVPTTKTVFYTDANKDGKPDIPAGTKTIGSPQPKTESTTTTTKASYWPAFRKAQAILKQNNRLYGWGLSDRDVTLILQQYAPSPSTKPKPPATGAPQDTSKRNPG